MSHTSDDDDDNDIASNPADPAHHPNDDADEDVMELWEAFIKRATHRGGAIHCEAPHRHLGHHSMEEELGMCEKGCDTQWWEMVSKTFNMAART